MPAMLRHRRLYRPTHPGLTCLLAVALAWQASCGTAPPSSITSDPSGPLHLSMYQASSSQPRALLRATAVETIGTNNQQISFGSCQVLVLGAVGDGLGGSTVLLRAPGGSWHRKGQMLVHLRGPLSMAGSIEGADSVALADEAWIGQTDDQLHLRNLRLWQRGSGKLRTATTAALSRDGRLRLEATNEQPLTDAERAQLSAVGAVPSVEEWQRAEQEQEKQH